MVQMRSRSRFRCALLAAVAIGTLVPGASALAQDQRRVEYRIEAGDLGEALKAVSRQSGKEIIFPSEAVLGHPAPALRGTYSADEAVRALLAGSGLRSDEHTSELQSLMRIPYAVFCLKKQKPTARRKN